MNIFICFFLIKFPSSQKLLPSDRGPCFELDAGGQIAVGAEERSKSSEEEAQSSGGRSLNSGKV